MSGTMNKIIGLKNRIFWLILAIGVYLFAESISLASLKLLSKINDIEYDPVKLTLSDRHREFIQKLIAEETSYIQLDPMLGWSIRKNGYVKGLYKANSDGIRADRDYQLIPPENVLRVASFGDSFTHCDDVSNQHTWQEYLTRIKPEWEVINFGVGGYGLDQAFLRYQRDGKKYRPHVVLIGYMSENINRHINVFRPFYMSGTGLPFAKPRFLVKEDGILLKENPLTERTDYEQLLKRPKDIILELGMEDWHYQQKPKENLFDFLPSVRIIRLASYMVHSEVNSPIIHGWKYNVDSHAFDLTLKIFDTFHKNVLGQEALPVIVLFPNKNNLHRFRDGRSNSFEPIIRHFENKGYQYIDLHMAFETYGKYIPLNQLFAGHYTPVANEIVAKYISDYIETKISPKEVEMSASIF